MTARAEAGAGPITCVPIGRLTEADLPAIIELTAGRDWSPQVSKWRLMFAVSEVYGVTDPAGGLAGIVVLTRYGRELAAIGMMVVAARHGRQGLGGKLMRYAVEQAGDAVVYLTATSYGQPLYERLGFRAVDSSVTYTGRPSAAVPGQDPRAASRRLGAADLAAIEAADRRAFGADRGGVLATMVTFADEFRMLGSPEAGYGAAWEMEGTRVVGPLVARDADAAAVLIRDLAAGWSGPIRLDILGRHAGLAGWALANGFAAKGRTALMVHGGELPGDRSRLYCPATVAIG